MMQANPTVENFQTDVADNPAYIKTLTQRHALAWPTFLIFMIALPAALSLIALVYQDLMHPVVASIFGGIAGYFLFTPIHEAIHRSVSHKEWVNTFIATLTVNILLPYTSLKLLRWGHMQHHRFTNEQGKDTDRILTSRWYGPLLLWPFFELFYLPQYLKAAHTRPKNEVRQVLWQMPLGFLALGLLLAVLGWKVALFWFLSSRIGLWLIVLVFVYLPHHPHTVLQKDDMYGATSLREGKEWLLNILMAGQNYHLVHHLYPTVPFYRMKDAWNARKAYHESHRPARVKAFGLTVERR